MTVFQQFPLLLEDSVLTTKPFVLVQKVPVWIGRPCLIRNHLHPLVQGRKTNPQIRRNLTPRQAAGERNANRIPLELVAVQYCNIRPP